VSELEPDKANRSTHKLEADIARLRAERDTLRKALKRIAAHFHQGPRDHGICSAEMRIMAEQALGEEKA